MTAANHVSESKWVDEAMDLANDACDSACKGFNDETILHLGVQHAKLTDALLAYEGSKQ